MDEFVSATIAEDRCDFSALATGDPGRINVRVSGQPAGELLSGLATNNDGIAAFEASTDADDARGQQTLPLFQSAFGTLVDNDLADGV